MVRFHKGSDAWGRDSYNIPQYAVMGSSDTGTSYDSPAPTNAVKAELNDFRKVLRVNKIRSKFAFTRSGNLFMVKRWVVVSSKDYAKSRSLAAQYLKMHGMDTQFIHDAD
jgi:hypothetical protein